MRLIVPMTPILLMLLIMVVAAMVFVLSFQFLAKEKHPDQYADCHQQEGPGYDEKIHPGWRQMRFRIMRDRRQAFSSDILSPKSRLNRCIR
jgi:hypothetical protein